MFTDKKSKFITHIKPVSTEEAALEFLARMRSEYSDATHNVYAYVIDENNIFRYSDDGEPGGTSGMPTLDVIRREGVVDVIAVTTRYFGGTLLGTGGLVHAYSTAARMALSDAGIVTRTLCDVLEIKCDYTLSGKIQYHIASEKYICENIDYGAGVTFTVCPEKRDTQKFIREITELTGARARISAVGEKYINIKEE